MLYKRNNSPRSPINAIAGLLVTVFVLVALFYVARFVFQLLWWVAPFMFIASLIIDHTVFLGFVGWIRKLFGRSPLLAVGLVVLCVIAFPLFSVYMLGRALLRKKAREIENEVVRRREGETADYEELDSQTLDLPRRPEPQPRRKDSDYDDYFEL